MIRPVRVLVACGALLAASGCTSPARSRALTLADGGAAVAKAAAASIVETQAAVDGYIEGQYLLGPLTGRPEPGEETLASLRRVRDALGARAAVMQSLDAAYAALHAHASFDAAGRVERGVNGLAGAVNAYGGALLGKQPGDSSGAWGLGKAGGVLAGAKQERELRAASAAIRESVERVVELLRRERDIHVSLRAILVEARGAAARQLWLLGLGRPGALLQRHVTGFGLAWDDKQLDGVLTLLRKEPSITGGSDRSREDDLRLAVGRVLEYRVQRQATLEGEILDETLAGLEGLALAHAAFEAKEEVDLTRLETLVAALRATLDEYRGPSGK
ncbi:MAG: hypothetical protein IPF66_23800 [Holophagales bacterium]|nr:hypothetical protein [Holophagales bacterium]